MKEFGERDPPENFQGQFLTKKQEASTSSGGLLGDWLGFQWQTPAAEVSTVGKQKQFGERPLPENAPKQEKFISAPKTEDVPGSPSKPAKKKSTKQKKKKEFGERVPKTKQTVMEQDLANAAKRATSPRRATSPSKRPEHGATPRTPAANKQGKEFGERMPKNAQAAMDEQLQKATAEKEQQQASTEFKSPIDLSFLMPSSSSSSPPKEFGEQQRRGNEGWTQDKYLMTIKKTDTPNEKERKFQLEKQMQKQLPQPEKERPQIPHGQTKMKSTKKTKPATPASPILAKTTKTMPQTPKSPSNPFPAPKEFGERTPAQNLQQLKFLETAEKKQASGVGFSLSSMLPTSLMGSSSSNGGNSKDAFRMTV